MFNLKFWQDWIIGTHDWKPGLFDRLPLHGYMICCINEIILTLSKENFMFSVSCNLQQLIKCIQANKEIQKVNKKNEFRYKQNVKNIWMLKVLYQISKFFVLPASSSVCVVLYCIQFWSQVFQLFGKHALHFVNIYSASRKFSLSHIAFSLSHIVRIEI